MPDAVVVHALRKSDFLSLRFELFNLSISETRRLVRVSPNAPATIVIHLPPQHLAEATFVGEASGTVLPEPPIAAAMSGGTRLAFRVPDHLDGLPLTLEALLDWRDWYPLLAAGAVPFGERPPAVTSPAVPGELETAIEFPWRLLLSPDSTSGWRHDLDAPVLEDAYQVWRTHLSHAMASDGSRSRTADGADLRAMAALGGEEPRLGAISALRRRQIVALSSNHELPSFVPRPIHANQLTLSALGATASLEGRWDFPIVPPEAGVEPIDLQQYKHMAAQGRDHFVRVVSVGFLCGTGHRASIVETTERVHGRLQQIGTDPVRIGATAYLVKRTEVVVQQAEVDYRPLLPAYAFDGREMPFRSIRLLTLSAEIVEAQESVPFWLRRDGETPVLFRARAIDLEGNSIEFELPLAYVPYAAIGNTAAIITTFYSPPGPSVPNGRLIELGGSAVAFAPAGNNTGSTTLRTGRLLYDLEVPGASGGMDALDPGALPPSYVPRFVPRVVGATAVVPAVVEMTGNATPQPFHLDRLYLEHGFGPGNAPESFVRLLQPVELDFASQRGGGLARPSSRADAVSRLLGPVFKPETMAQGGVDLSAFQDAKFLGTIRLLDIIDPGISFDAALASGESPSVPRLTTRRFSDRIETRFLWKPRLRDAGQGALLEIKLDNAALVLDVRSVQSASGRDSSLIQGHLTGATLSFKDAISVTFDELIFRSEEGKKLEVNAKGVRLRFAGPLSFINALQSILPEDGFDDPPFLTVDGQGVVAGYTLGVPTVGVGIFSLQNIALSAALSVPFTDRPAGVRFSVSERHKPFLLTVSGFGGGGFFAMAVSANGIEQVEASLEFGGNISLNLVVASGGVYVMAGIYFGLTGNSVTLTGYLRCGGALEVLGLISISVEFYLGFTFRSKNPGSEVWGQARLTVCVKVAFFSKSVSLSVERRFAGSDGDPPFSVSVSRKNWARYLLAFAA